MVLLRRRIFHKSIRVKIAAAKSPATVVFITVVTSLNCSLLMFWKIIFSFLLHHVLLYNLACASR